MKLTRLNTGQFIGLEVIEVTSIPHVNNLNDENGEEKFKEQFKHILGEFYQSHDREKASLELMLLTEPVEHQTYKANVRLFFVVRVIDDFDTLVSEVCATIVNLLQSSLSLLDYVCVIKEFEDYASLLKQVNQTSTKSILKDGKTANLHNNLLPSWFVYPKMKLGNLDLSNLYNTLVNYPNCAVSMHLTPTTYSTSEKDFLAQSVQNLNILSKGVMDRSLGTTIQFSLVDNYVSDYQYYLSNAQGVLFKYGMSVYGSSQAVSDIASKLSSLFFDYNQSLSEVLDIKYLHDINSYIPASWVYESALDDYYNESYQQFPEIFRELTNIITLEEAGEFFRLPLGTDKISAGLPVVEKRGTQKSYRSGLLNSDNLVVGTLRASNYHDELGISVGDLTKHMLVSGMPGSGKTTFLVSLLNRLWNDYHIPFLVIEPAKNEYRALIDKIPDLQVFSPGKKQVSPFIFNPFYPPKNVRLESYKATLKTGFEAAISLESPLDHIFEEALHNCYSDYGWLDDFTSDDGGKIFNISDFIKVFRKTFEAIGYTGDAKNIGRAGEVRLNSLVSLFDHYYSIPIEDMLSKPTIVELSGIENSEQKSLIIALLLLSILAYVNANYLGDGQIKNILLLEEAHVLLGAKTRSDQATSSEIAQELLKRMLAEIRSYGVGIIVADQSPRKVSEDVVSLTDIKLSFRLVETKDKQIIADSINLQENDVDRLSRLKPGEAYFYFNKLDDPEEIKTPNYRDENDIRIFVGDEEISRRMTYWKKHQDKLKPYPQCPCKRCDYHCKLQSQDLARKIFNRYFVKNTNDVERLKKVIPYLKQIVEKMIEKEKVTPQLLACVKVHLYRKIRNETRIGITDEQMKRLIEK